MTDELDAATLALRRCQARLAAIIDLLPEPAVLLRLDDGILVEVSGRFAELFGFRPQELAGRAPGPADLGLWPDAAEQQRLADACDRKGGVLSGFGTALRRRDGVVVRVILSGRVLDVAGERCLLAQCRTLASGKAPGASGHAIGAEALARLPDRFQLVDRLRDSLGRLRDSDRLLAVCHLDLDGFKAVNDSFGHATGDRLLEEVATRLQAAVRASDAVARIGGDEFVLLLAGVASDRECTDALSRLLLAISMPYVIDGRELIAVSASIGATLFPRDDSDADGLLRHAAEALYAAKKAGRNRYSLFPAPRHPQ